VVPGSGFGQLDGTWHFRTTFLPPQDQLADVLERLKAFQTDFLATYADAS
jgi:alanine transaminase